ncbi:MAG: cysteine desulfurase NifS [Oscillospiraceae bacterium]|jgi:cysteine desulfurase|nr:cysteine desulfurase NifS [Oscillospiraceae bacterium]
MKRFVYADSASTTKMNENAIKAMIPFLSCNFSNASSLYRSGREARKALEQSREKIAKILGASLPSEIFFTSGGSEADNWAIRGACNMLIKQNKKHIISSAFEHHAVLHTLQALEKEGYSVTYLDVYKEGIVRPEDVENAIREDTALVTIMYSNNEIGTIQPIEEIGKICRKNKVLFHTDAVGALANVQFDLKNQSIDMLSASAHKVHGPKGVGALYIKKGLNISNLIEGGAQERNRRAGTENVAGIVGFSVALEETHKNLSEKNKKLSALRDRLIKGISKIEKVVLNGHPTERLPGNVNVSFEGIEGESLLLRLDSEGICASSGSACTSGSLEPSHVLLAIGLSHEVAHGSLRLTLDENNTEEDVDHILNRLPGVVFELRNMSPLWEKIKCKA